MKRLLAAICLLALTGCGISANLVTPSSPLTYGWVMAHNYDAWGVQIGPKVDLAGTHVAVYAWSATVIPGWTVCPPEDSCGSEIFQRYDALNPNEPHDYAVVWTADGWQMQFDHRVLMVINVGSPNTARYESDTGEQTAK